MGAILLGLLGLGFVPCRGAERDWTITTLDAEGNTGTYAELLMGVGGRLHVVYLRADNGTLRALTRDGGVWGAPQTIDASGSVNGYCALAVTPDGDLPVSYRRGSDGALWYAGPQAVRTWAATAITAEVDDVGRWLTVERQTNGDLGLAFRNQTDGSLLHMRREGTTWTAIETVDPGPLRGQYCDLTYRPGVGYAFSEQGLDGTCVYFADLEIAPRAWSASPITAETDDVGRWLTVERQTNGDLGLAFRNQTDGSLLHMRREGATWTAIETVDPGPLRGQYCDLTYRPGVGYAFSEQGLDGTCVYFADLEIAPRAWSASRITNEADDVGRWLRAERRANGDFALAFRNETDGSLLHMRREGATWTAIETVDAGPSRGQYCDLTYRPGVGYAFSEYASDGTSMHFADPAIAPRFWRNEALDHYEDVGRQISMVVGPLGRLNYTYLGSDTAHGWHIRAGEYLPDSVRILRPVVDSVAVSGGDHVHPDIFMAPGQNWYLSFRNAVDHHLYFAMTESLQIVESDVEEPWPNDPGATAVEAKLLGAQPNPAAGRLRIYYTAPKAQPVELLLLDPSGRVVRRVEESCQRGTNWFDLDGAAVDAPRLAAGVYFVRMRIGDAWLNPKRLVLTR